MESKVVGLLGGGQLGRMFLEAANRLNIKVNVLDAPNAPAKQISNHDGHFDGSFKDPEAVKKLSKTCDVVTVEIEHVNTQVLEEISGEVAVEPSWKTIRTIQDKYAQKEHLQKHNVATAESLPLESNTVEELEKVGQKLGLPFMLKSRTEAYDGRGNYPVKSSSDFEGALKALGQKPLYAEKWANFKMELAVMVVKGKDQVLAYPAVETIHEDSICKLVYAPARNVPSSITKKAQELAKKAVSCFWGKGVFGVEMFLNQDDSLLINEIAPRPHNSGHYTIEACPMSQYEAHLRAILDLHLDEEGVQPYRPSVMLNILGGASPQSAAEVAKKATEQSTALRVHMYAKGDARPGRKMGHITVLGSSMAKAEGLMKPMIDVVDEVRRSRTDIPAPSSGSSEPKTKQTKALVSILMGSYSDMPVLDAGVQILEKLGITYETHITSAHRTPEWMGEYVASAAPSGIKVIIAAAGGAAHLPGMAASHTYIPVIGVPVKPTIGDGTDSLLSICNMPRGIPVATVGINNSTNAALLAARILGVAEDEIAESIRDYAEGNRKEVMEKEAKMQQLGWKGAMQEWHAKK
ncbi:hypothetical protein M8818_004636 [Zalaria obscura]|uniref:Uncharacterized protein n=1 Tax=Zalaria obscura TaxID=2024903 RepID=A0ACC3SES1_9PEZI